MNIFGKTKGFTLVELLVVISILGILAVVVMANFSTAKKSSRDNKRKADLENVAGSVEIFYSEKKHYPNTNDSVSDWASLRQAIAPYSASIPEDPKNTDGFAYQYVGDGSTGKWFVLYAKLESNKENITLGSVSGHSDNLESGNGVYKVGEELYYRVIGK